MRKTLIQGLITILLFFSIWFALTQINWVTVFKVKEVTNKTEEKLGEIFWEIFKKNDKENKNPVVVNSVDSLINKICSANKIDRQLIKVHIVDKDEINAFAIPDGHLVIYSGLILNSENEEELSGVICHEIAHIQLNHVMKKLITEIGLSGLISMTTGNGGSEVIKATAKMLSSSAFDRNLEKEADIKAVDYLVNAKINPEPFANFLFKISTKDHEATQYLTWISTHPDTRERAEYILEYSKNKKTKYEPIITLDTWNKLKEKLQQ